MLNLSVTPAVRNSRLEKCHGCKFFQSNFGTCGTPVVGKYVELPQNEATYYKEKIRLCGCVMKIKTKLKFASCPIGKWGPDFIDGQLLEKMRGFLEGILTKSSLTWEEVVELYNYINSLSKRRYKVSSCPTCIANFITELAEHLGIKHVDLTTLVSNHELTPELKQLIKQTKNGDTINKTI